MHIVVSLVIPVFNERESLQRLHAAIDAVSREHRLAVEMVFVDDGSTDGSWSAICALAKLDRRVRAARFRRNFGKTSALACGFHMVAGDVIVTMDADLQDDPAEIPRLLDALNEGRDVVCGWKQQRQDPWHRVVASRVFNGLVSFVTGVRLHDHNCGLKAYRAAVVREIPLHGDLHRFIPVLAEARGFRVGEIPVRHHARPFGRSKFGATRYMKGLLDLLSVKFVTRFRRRPQHLLGFAGLLSCGLGAAGMLYLAALWVYRTMHGLSPDLHKRPLLIYSAAAAIVGVQMVTVGLLAELVAAYANRENEDYSLAETIRPGPDDTSMPSLQELHGRS